MNKEEQMVKEIFETLIKYTNLTPDAIDDLYYLQGYIEEKDKEIERLNNGIDEIIKDIEHSTLLLEEGQVELKDTPFGKRILERLKELKEGK